MHRQEMRAAAAEQRLAAASTSAKMEAKEDSETEDSGSETKPWKFDDLEVRNKLRREQYVDSDRC